MTQDSAAIQVTDAHLYMRKNLIQERREEWEYLADFLSERRNVEFARRLMRDIEIISSLSLQLDLSIDVGSKQ